MRITLMAKKWIHPQYFNDVKVTDIDGNVFYVNTTVEGPIKVETSYMIHPAYTGEQKSFAKASRVQKFQEKLERMKKLQNAS